MAATPNRQDSSWGTAGRADFGYREWSENGGSGTNGASPRVGRGRNCADGQGPWLVQPGTRAGPDCGTEPA